MRRTVFSAAIVCFVVMSALVLVRPVRAQGTGSISAMPRAVRDEVDRLASDDPGRRATAAESLAEMGRAAAPAIPWLIAAMSDHRPVISLREGNTEVRYIAAHALGQIGRPAVTQLVALVQNTSADDSLRIGAVTALGWFREPTALDPLLAALKALDLRKETQTRSIISTLSEALSCFPEERVANAILEATERLQAGGADRLEPLNDFTAMAGQRYGTFASPAKAREWWTANKSQLALKRGNTCVSIPVVQ